jgi:hypothetical protein
MLDKKIENLFNNPKVIALAGDVNTAKSNILYYFISELKKSFNFNLFSYGLKSNLGETKIYSLEEAELIKDSVVIIDEVASLLDLDDRKKRRSIERTFRLIAHNNNIIILSGIPENYKKFLCGKISIYLFTKSTIGDFINGSRYKTICLNYKGEELGSAVLNMPLGSMLLFDGKHYHKFKIPYLPKFDSKRDNPNILSRKDVIKTVTNNVEISGL